MARNMWMILIVFCIGLVLSGKVMAAEIIGPHDPRYAHEMGWFEDDWFTQLNVHHRNNQKYNGFLLGEWTYKGKHSYLLSTISWRLGINLLTPYVKTNYKTRVAFVGFEDFIQLDTNSAEAFYVIDIIDKDFHYQAHFRTKREKTANRTYKGQNTNLLYIADKAISSELFYDILPYFLKKIDVRMQSNYFIHIEHVASNSRAHTSTQLWTLAGDGRRIAQAEITIKKNSHGRIHFHVEKNPSIMETRPGSMQLMQERAR